MKENTEETTNEYILGRFCRVTKGKYHSDNSKEKLLSLQKYQLIFIAFSFIWLNKIEIC